MRTLLAASGGGHLTELVQLRQRLAFDPGEVTWFTPDTPQSRSMLQGERVVHADLAPPRDWRAAVRNARLAGAMCRRGSFDVAVSTGASIALSTLPIAHRHGARVHYVESAARVSGPSVSGRMLALAQGVNTYTQHPGWSNVRWPYAGSVFDSFEPGPDIDQRGVDRIVVTLGSQRGYPFDRLVERLVRVLPVGAEVTWQTGGTDPRAHGVVGRVSMPHDELIGAIAGADLVIAHAGVGSALSALEAGRHPVLVGRRRALGEHVDDHQLQIAEELSKRGLATACEPEEITAEVLARAARRRVVVAQDPPPLLLDE